MSTLTNNRRKRDGLWAYFILTYVLMGLTWGLMALLQIPAGTRPDTGMEASAGAMLLLLLGGFTPSIAALIVSARLQGRAGLRNLGKRMVSLKANARWYLAIIVLPASVAMLQALIYKLRSGSFIQPDFIANPVMLLATAIPIFIAGPLSEELGWRGFALDRVLSRWNALTANVILGLFWACWHIPLYFIPGVNQQELGIQTFAWFAIEVQALTFLLAWVYKNTNRSIGIAILFHFTVNFADIILFSFLENGGSVERWIGTGIKLLVAAIVTARDVSTRSLTLTPAVQSGSAE